MTPEALAACHARAFAGRGRAWRADELAQLLADPQVIVAGTAEGFVLARIVAGEAEILTVATEPAARRRGLARAALDALHAEAARRGADRVFLEVGAGNHAARALYQALGYRQVGLRAGYYAHPDGQREDALVLERGLTP